MRDSPPPLTASLWPRLRDLIRTAVTIQGRLITLPVAVVGMVLIIVSSAVIGAAAGGLVVPEPEPGVETDYDDTFRVLASNDRDPGRSSQTVGVFEYADNGSITAVNRTVVTQPVQLWDSNIQSRDALLIANQSDMYQSGLQGFVQIPYRDRWTPLMDWWDTELRILPLYSADPSRATSTDGRYTVEVRHPNGWWNPVYNAEVERINRTLAVTNPDEALVHSSYYSTVIDRKLQIVESLLQHSAMAATQRTARQTASIPTHNGSEVFPTTDGASVDLPWRPGSHDLVKDAYVGVIDVYPGVWHDGRYVTPSWQFGTYVPWDYRIDVPSDYSDPGTCTIGNTTYPLTRWAEYRLLDADADVVNVTAGPISLDRSRPGLWTTVNLTSSAPRHLPPGEYELTATLRIETELETHYGVSSAQCGAWDSTRTSAQTVELEYTVPIETVNSDNLSVDVQVYDRPGRDVVSVNWTGKQGLAAGAAAWKDVEVQIGKKTMYVTAPWRFYSISRNTHVEERTSRSTTAIEASHSHQGTYPAMLHYRMSPASVSVLADKPADQHVWWNRTYVVQNRSVPATALPDSIVATQNTKRTYLYDQFAGVLKSTDQVTGESVTAQASDVWGLPVNTSVSVTRYRDSELTVTVNQSTGTAEVFLTSATGLPLSGRPILLDGAAVDSVTTGADGRATVDVTGTIVRAHFAGDHWRDSRPAYYLEAHGYGVSQTLFVGGATGVLGYLSTAISNSVIFVEWLVFGIFALLWMRFMRERPAGRR
jgi:hypothetical protein